MTWYTQEEAEAPPASAAASGAAAFAGNGKENVNTAVGHEEIAKPAVSLDRISALRAEVSLQHPCSTVLDC